METSRQTRQGAQLPDPLATNDLQAADAAFERYLAAFFPIPL
jgi:hypothetical protein